MMINNVENLPVPLDGYEHRYKIHQDGRILDTRTMSFVVPSKSENPFSKPYVTLEHKNFEGLVDYRKEDVDWLVVKTFKGEKRKYVNRYVHHLDGDFRKQPR